MFCSDFKFHYRYDDKTHTLYRDGEEIPYTPAILSHIFNSRWDVRSNGSEDGTYLYKENVSATRRIFRTRCGATGISQKTRRHSERATAGAPWQESACKRICAVRIPLCDHGRYR
ncbi:MAG: hypothetical protein ACLR23_09150 [Clostridia bacterium]